jgi:pimeloyl-ACP methyl ester carboxylesterase
LHGGTSNLESWIVRGVLPNLEKDFRVIAFDARGHGKSDKPRDPSAYGRQQALDVVRLLDALRIDRAHIVGYSLGGSTVAQLLTLHPDLDGRADFGSRALACIGQRPPHRA